MSDPWTCEECGRPYVVPSLAADCAQRDMAELDQQTAPTRTEREPVGLTEDGPRRATAAPWSDWTPVPGVPGSPKAATAILWRCVYPVSEPTTQPPTRCARCDWSGPRTDLPQHARDAQHPLCVACAPLHRSPASLPADRPQVCLPCESDVRAWLLEVVELYAVLPDVLDRLPSQWSQDRHGSGDSARMPGGDALVMLAGGSDGRSQTRLGVDTSHEVDEYPGDPQSALFVLGSWERDWRETRHERATGPTTVSGSVAYLTEPWRWRWAVASHPAWDELAADVHRLVQRMRAVTGHADAVDRAGADCFGCGGTLVRKRADPAPCEHTAPSWDLDRMGYDPALGYGESVADRDARVTAWEAEHSRCEQGGAPEEWACERCKRRYSREAYHLAVAQRYALAMAQREHERQQETSGDSAVSQVS